MHAPVTQGVTMTSAAMEATMQSKRIIAFYKEEFQLTQHRKQDMTT